MHCIEDQPYALLQPGERISESMTLMRGAEGALFGVPGVHEVKVEVHWEIDGMVAHAAGSATVMVTAAVEARHAEAAHRVLSTPDAHLVLAIGGDHLTEGLDAIQAALDSPVLKPHFAAIAAKRLAKRFHKRKADPKNASALLDYDTVMSDAERSKLTTLISDAGGVLKDLGKAPKARARPTNLAAGAK